jgi:hypothetical protein
MSIVKARSESWLRIDRKTHQRLRKIKASSRVLGPIVFFLFGWCAHWCFHATTTILFLPISNNGDTAVVFHSMSNHTSTIASLSSSLSATTTTTKILSSTMHTHKIPNILIFTYYENLLLPPPPSSPIPPLKHETVVVGNSINSSINKNDSAPTKEEELRALRKNIQHTISLHPAATIRFLTDDDCLTSIKNVVPYLNLPYAARVSSSSTSVSTDSASISASTNATSVKTLMEYFTAEPLGMYKGDICRGAALYETGGLYFDVDLGVRMNVFTGHGEVRMDTEHEDISSRKNSSSFVLNTNTEFVTVKVPLNSKDPRGFFTAFLGTTARHPILKRYLELFWLYYAHQLPSNVQLPEKSLYSVMLLRHAYDEILQQERESSSSAIESIAFNYSSKRSFTVYQSKTTELWQEVYYYPQPPKWLAHVPPPNWGNQESCRYVVVTSLPLDYQSNDPTITPEELMYILLQLKQIRAQGDAQVPSIVVPFYCHIGDSRSCSISAYQSI